MQSTLLRLIAYVRQQKRHQQVGQEYTASDKNEQLGDAVREVVNHPQLVHCDVAKFQSAKDNGIHEPPGRVEIERSDYERHLDMYQSQARRPPNESARQKNGQN